MEKTRVFLVPGATGQIGVKLVPFLREEYGLENVTAGVHTRDPEKVLTLGPTLKLDVTNEDEYKQAIAANSEITDLIHLPGILSGRAEERRDLAWNLNIGSLTYALEIVRDKKAQGKPIKFLYPSSIAVFGPETPKDDAPQEILSHHPTTMDEITDVAGYLLAGYYGNLGITDYRHSNFWDRTKPDFTSETTFDDAARSVVLSPPTTLYGVTKVIGELLAEWFFNEEGIDVRTIRYAGLVSEDLPEGRGTTDWAAGMFHAAAAGEEYVLFVSRDTRNPMQYMQETLDVTHALLEAPWMQHYTAYNSAGDESYTPTDLEQAINKFKPANVPQLRMVEQLDHRDGIAKSWVRTANDKQIRQDLNLGKGYDTQGMVEDMFRRLEPVYNR